MSLTPEEWAVMSHHDAKVDELMDPYQGLSPFAEIGLISYENFWAAEIISFVDALDGPDVLALGCGTARDAKLFIEEGANYVGIDFSAKVLQGAISWVPRPTVARMNMRELAFADNSFDGTWSFDSFSYIPKTAAPAVLKEMHRVTKPGGLSYISACPEPAPIKQALNNYWPQDELTHVVRQAGYKIVNLRHDTSEVPRDPYITLMLTPSK